MEPKLRPKAEYGFTARDVVSKGLPVTNNFEQATGKVPSQKAEYGFGANKMANAGMPFSENFEQYMGIPMKAPAVVNTNPLRDTIQKNSQFVNTAQQYFYPTPTGQNIPSPALTPNVKTPTTVSPNGAAPTSSSQNSQPTVQPPQPIQNTFGNNPALSSAVDQLNATISTFKGEMTPEQQATYNSIKEASDKYSAAIAAATSAKESGDFRTFNEKANEAKVAAELRQEEINNLITSTKDLRQKYIDSLNPSQNEIDLETQLADLRASAELGAEAQYGLGRPLSISTGRAEKVLNQGAIKEKNLLAKLGIEVKKREAKSEGLKAGLGFLQDDIQLQMKVQERLDKQQESILARADKLNDNQRNAMATLADKFKDVDLSTASPEVIRGIQQFALNQGVDASLAMSIIEGAHDQQIYDNAIAGTKASATAMSGETFGLDPSDPIFGAITGLKSVKAQDAALKRYSGFVKSGNKEAADKYLDSVALSTLSQGQKEDFGVYSDGQRIINNVLGDIDKFKSTNLNPYKTAVERLKPLAGLQKDQVWVDITSQIEQAQARIRRGFFGTALTGTEKSSADKFLIDFASDDIATAETKLKSMRQLATDIKRRLLNEASGKFDIGKEETFPGTDVDLSDLDFSMGNEN